jgi:hypothetical protein
LERIAKSDNCPICGIVKRRLIAYLVTSVVRMIVDGVRFDSVGVRLEGNTTFRHPNMKKPMRIVFNEFLKDRRWDGLKSIYPNNCCGDPTIITARAGSVQMQLHGLGLKCGEAGER